MLALSAITPTLVLVFLSGGLSASDLADVRVDLRHIADSPGSLFLGEPLDLLVTTTNDGSRTLRGHFAGAPYDTNAAFYWHREGQSPTRLDEPYVPPKLQDMMLVVKPPIWLNGGQSVKADGRILFDPRTGGLRIPASGEYEIFVVLRPLVDDARQEVRSNTLQITVAGPPERFRAAFAAYLGAHLEALVTSPMWRLSEEPASAAAAEAFLQEHAESPYGRHVQEALLKGLRVRAATNKATPVEKEVYHRLETNESIRRSLGMDKRP